MEIVKCLSYLLDEWFLLDNSFLLLILSGFAAAIYWYFISRKHEVVAGFTWEEEEEIIKNFKPLDLVPGNAIPPKRRIIESRVTKFATVESKECLNLASHNYLGLAGDDEVTRLAADCISKYGVGSCGPRGFYGTADVHIQLEEELAAFFQAEETCVYAYGFSTAASAIPAYCKRRDVIFADEFVNFAIQKGFDASRSTVVYFKHNDMEDLEKLLKKDIANEKQKKNRPRKFLVVEGIYQRTGEICPLPELVRLRKQYQLRMFLDESISFGVLGATGRGVLEQFGVPVEDVDLRIGSLEGTFASVGGFCVGSSFIVEHQRLSGLGYCFSASLPPLLAVGALTSLSHLRNQPSLVEQLANNCRLMNDALTGLPGFDLGGHELSPVKFLYPKESKGYDADSVMLQDLADKCISRGLLVLPPACLPMSEITPPRGCLRVVVTNLLNSEDIKTAREILIDAINGKET